MRDLKADLAGIQSNPPASYASLLPMEIVMEYLQRAIAAENLLASHAPEGHNVTNMQYQELRAENAELKRQLFNAETCYKSTAGMVENLSGRVAALREGLEFTQHYWNMEQTEEAMKDALWQILNTTSELLSSLNAEGGD